LHYRLSDIARIINGEQTIVADIIIEQLLLDSRKVHSPAISLFFALKGIRRDGHHSLASFIKKASEVLLSVKNWIQLFILKAIFFL
jgi:alanine racemase